MNNDERRKMIIDFISVNAGCSVEECFKGIREHMARSTFFKLLSELKADNEVMAEKRNKRDQKLFLNNNNLLVSVPKDLEQFEKAFISLSKKLKKIQIQSSLMLPVSLDFKKVKLTEIDTSNISPSFIQIQQLSLERLSIFFRMIDSFLFRCTLVWPKQIQDRETLKKLYHIVFTKIADMNMNFIQSRTDSKFSNLDLLIGNSKLNNLDLLIGNYHLSDHVFKRLGGVDSLYSYQEKFKEIGMQKEIEVVIDSLWDIDKEIQQLAYKEPQIYGFHFKYRSDDWRTLIELRKEHVGKEPR